MDKDTFFNKKQNLRIKGNYLQLDVPKVAGILNVTPDSFYDGGRYTGKESIAAQVEKMISEGADIIDIGASSSRPGAKEISSAEEYRRLAETLQIIRTRWPRTIISVDTTKAEIAKKVIENYQVDIINDISGGLADDDMFDIIATYQVPYVIMHMKGVPETMQQHAHYDDLIREVLGYFSERLQDARKKGIHDIIIDPGFGFAKTPEHNFQLLCHLSLFRILELPLMVGLSRKSLIYRTLNITPGESLNGSTALHTMALERGADILRVHDVKEAKQTIELFQRMKTEGNKYYDVQKSE